MKKKILRFKVLEAKSIESEYLSNWSSIPRDIFDKIIAMDPQTSIERNNIGPTAKQLLLPRYLSGEVTFVENSNEVKNAIDTFIKNRNNYEVKNVALYPSVDIFVKHINDPENNPIETTEVEVKQESKLDKIYNQYYSDIDKDTFLYIISLDPSTNIEKGNVGNYAKNLLLRLYKKGVTKIADKSLGDDIKKAIEYVEENKNIIDKKYLQINTLPDIDEFIDLPNAVVESDHLKYLKNSPYWKDIRYVGSTQKYDIFVPLNSVGAAAIAGADSALRLPSGAKGPGINSQGSVAWSSNLYGQWCTTEQRFWNSYNREGQLYYNFMAKGEKLYSDNRKHNYQLAIKPNGDIDADRGVADGEEDYKHANIVRPRLFSEDPTICAVLAKENNYAANLPEVKSYLHLKAQGDTFTYEGEEKYNNWVKEFSSNELTLLTQSILKKLIISNNVTNIPPMRFAGWGIKEIVFGNNVKTIGAQAFKGCINLQLLRLPESLEYIGSQAFASCISLHGTTTLHNNVKRLGRQAFYDTDITLSLLSDRPDNSLMIDEKDKQWFADHAKFVNVTNEEIELDEKIPRDLANIYKSKDVSTPNSNNYNRSRTNRRDMSRRRRSPYDFENASYEIIDAEEALRRVKNNKADVNKIRAIYGSELLECELRTNGKIYPLIIPQNIYEYTELNIDQVRHKVQSMTGLLQVLSSADKIYWTDEYEHLIDDNSAIAQKRKQNSTTINRAHLPNNEAERNVLASSGPYVHNYHVTDNPRDETSVNVAGDTYYQANSNFPDTLRYWGNDAFDTGSHGYPASFNYYHSARDHINKYAAAWEQKNTSYKKYTLSRKALNHLIKNREYYDDGDYTYLYDEMSHKIKEAYDQYKEDYDNFIKAKKNFLTYSSENTKKLDTIYKKAIMRISVLKNILEKKETELKKLYDDLRVARNKSIVDDESYQEVINTIKTLESAINLTQNSIETKKQSIENYKQKIAELEREIIGDDENLVASTQELERQRNSINDVAETVAEKLSDDVDQISANIEELKEWFVNTGAKKFDKQKHKELADNIAQLLNIIKADEGTEEIDDALEEIINGDEE